MQQTAPAPRSPGRILAKVIRVATIPPVGSFTLTTSLFVAWGQAYCGRLSYWLSVLFLSVFPVLAYPLQPLLKRFRHRGREGQRSLAILMSVIGYLCGGVWLLFSQPSPMYRTVFLSYVISGALIALFSKGFGIHASGHACGIAGPVAGMTCFLGAPVLLPGLPILLATFWSSLKLKRHTAVEFLLGGAISVAATVVLGRLFGAI